GFPAGLFYFPLPALASALLDVVLPYGVAMKAVLVAGPLLLPVACWRFARASRLPQPTPALFATAAVVFSADHFHTIYGGNLASVAAGMFSVTLGTALAFLALADLQELIASQG